MIEADVPVVEVTVQEDRALVRREGTLTLTPGRSQLRLSGVAPVLVDKSLVAELLAPDGKTSDDDDARPRVRGVVARRWRVTEQSQRPEAQAQLRDQLHEAQTQLADARTRLADLEAEHAEVAAVLEMTIQELSEDAGWGTVESEASHAALDGLQERLTALGAEHCALLAQCERQQRELADLQQLAAAHDTVDAHAAAALELELWNPTEVDQTARLRVDYLVPGALWRPWHRASLVEDESGARVQLRCEGCVWQATGEDWNDVQLWFSTERPSLGLSPPTLATDRLAVRKKGSTVQVQARSEQIHTAGLGSNDATVETAEDLPGIDDGGEAQRLRGRGRSTVPGDGRPHRVPLFELESPADVSLTCIPELASAVLLRSEQTNTAAHPLLAGPVDLMRHSGLVGRTSVLYIAPGERFELGWGPDNALRVVREVESLEWERKTLSSWTRKPRRVRIKLSNLEAAPRSIEVRERIAVSEIDKVKVELSSSNPQTTADADGFLQWDVRLPGLGRQELSVEWTMVVHDDVQGL